VIIAPGEVLTRSTTNTTQDRSLTGINIASNYLDAVTIGGIAQDNQNFADFSSLDGFIQGNIKDSNGNWLVNDQLLVITQDQLMMPIQKRVAAELKQCLHEYAAASASFDRYPWAAKLTPASPVSYNDSSGILFGRIPDNPFTATSSTSSNQMNDTWMGNCNINSNSGWWLNWKEIVFYGLSDAYKPIAIPGTASACGACQSVTPSATTNDKRFVVIVAGKILATQIRSNNTDKGTPSNYLEDTNRNADQSGSHTFTQNIFSSSFNDTLVSE
jgi:hypothetical protein